LAILTDYQASPPMNQYQNVFSRNAGRKQSCSQYLSIDIIDILVILYCLKNITFVQINKQPHFDVTPSIAL